MRMPKTIKNHPAVLEVSSGYEGGADTKYEVVLKKDWCFYILESRPNHETIRRLYFCNTVNEFLNAKPRKLVDVLGEKEAQKLLKEELSYE